MNSLNYERLSGDKIGLSSVRVYEQYRREFQEVMEEGQTIATICNLRSCQIIINNRAMSNDKKTDLKMRAMK